MVYPVSFIDLFLFKYFLRQGKRKNAIVVVRKKFIDHVDFRFNNTQIVVGAVTAPNSSCWILGITCASTRGFERRAPWKSASEALLIGDLVVVLRVLKREGLKEL